MTGVACNGVLVVDQPSDVRQAPPASQQKDGFLTTTDKPAVRLEHLYKSFGAHVVLSDINLSVDTGEVLAIIGPSGSGKSTLLRCINYLEPPERGTVTVGGVTLNGEAGASGRDLRRLRQNSAWCSSRSTCSPI